MRIVLAGLGRMGSNHVRHLTKAGHRLVTVDTKGHGDVEAIEDVPEPGSVDSWIVATPTQHHLDGVERVLAVQRNARILLEKPACYPQQIADLVSILGSAPASHVVVNDIYAYSRVVEVFAAEVARRLTFDPLNRISIEFTKNRTLDELNGRFIDFEYGEVGYEVFHMLSLLRKVLPADVYAKTLEGGWTRSDGDELHVHSWIGGEAMVDLYSSMRGRVGYPGVGELYLENDPARQILKGGEIPTDSDLKYRIADVEFRSGVHVSLIFEPDYGGRGDYRNRHRVYVTEAEGLVVTQVAENHLAAGLEKQLRLLQMGPVGTSLLRLNEHRLMARFSSSLHTQKVQG